MRTGNERSMWLVMTATQPQLQIHQAIIDRVAIDMMHDLIYPN